MNIKRQRKKKVPAIIRIITRVETMALTMIDREEVLAVVEPCAVNDAIQ
jgi:hypothetical protein